MRKAQNHACREYLPKKSTCKGKEVRSRELGASFRFLRRRKRSKKQGASEADAATRRRRYSALRTGGPSHQGGVKEKSGEVLAGIKNNAVDFVMKMLKEKAKGTDLLPLVQWMDDRLSCTKENQWSKVLSQINTDVNRFMSGNSCLFRTAALVVPRNLGTCLVLTAPCFVLSDALLAIVKSGLLPATWNGYTLTGVTKPCCTTITSPCRCVPTLM